MRRYLAPRNRKGKWSLNGDSQINRSMSKKKRNLWHLQLTVNSWLTVLAKLIEHWTIFHKIQDSNGFIIHEQNEQCKCSEVKGIKKYFLIACVYVDGGRASVCLSVLERKLTNFIYNHFLNWGHPGDLKCVCIFLNAHLLKN